MDRRKDRPMGGVPRKETTKNEANARRDQCFFKFKNQLHVDLLCMLMYYDFLSWRFFSPCPDMNNDVKKGNRKQ
jgi:hypothetical protein